MSRARALVLAILACLAFAPAARALDKVQVGTAVWPIWAFLPLQVGIDEGIWPRYGIDPEIVNMGSGAKLIQALTAKSVEFGLSSGVEMAFAAKGAPIRAIAAFAGDPRTVAIIVTADSPVKGPADLKGKTIAMPGIGSVSEWLVWQMSIAEGWGKNGVKIVSGGSLAGCIALIKSHQVDAAIGPPELGYALEEKGEGRVAFGLERYAPHFLAHVVYGRTDLIQSDPDLVRRFLEGYFASIRFVKTHKTETTAIAVRELHSSPAVMARIWDELAPWLQDKGTFDPQAVEVLKQSYVDLGILDKKPSNDEILTTQFVPVKP
jgi:ABC-type nitrate/sulfonate/bicarbonate transport system substrate-binding protein